MTIPNLFRICLSRNATKEKVHFMDLFYGMTNKSYKNTHRIQKESPQDIYFCKPRREIDKRTVSCKHVLIFLREENLFFSTAFAKKILKLFINNWIHFCIVFIVLYNYNLGIEEYAVKSRMINGLNYMLQFSNFCK